MPWKECWIVEERLRFIARLVQLSWELRTRGYSGQVSLHFGSGRVNSVRQEEVIDWSEREAS